MAGIKPCLGAAHRTDFSHLRLVQHETSDAAAVGLCLFYFCLNTGVHNPDDVSLGIEQSSY